MKPKVSVIVPVFNREDLIERCLDSIFNQTRKPDELIVVDNNSTDNTAARVGKWMEEHAEDAMEFKLLVCKERGACRARQTGMDGSTGDYLIFFDSDDAMHTDLVEKALGKLEQEPEADVVCWKCRINMLDGGKRVPPFRVGTDIESHLIHALLRPQGYIVKKSFLDKAGAWRKPVKVWNDFELGLRILLRNPKTVYLDEVLAEIYSQKESITGLDFSSREGEWEKVLDEMEKENSILSHPDNRRIRKMLDYRRVILAAHYYREGNRTGAENLFGKTMMDKGLRDRMLLSFSYHYTKSGFRGVWRIVRNFYR